MRQRAADIVLLVCVVVLSVATWAEVYGADGVVAWKHCIAVAVTMFLALAAVTPHEAWAYGVRLAISGWLLMVPWLLVERIPTTRWTYWAAAALIAVLSTPGLRLRYLRAAGSRVKRSAAAPIAAEPLWRRLDGRRPEARPLNTDVAAII
jgi:hypothetical protein